MYDDWVNNTSLKQEYGYTLSELGSSYRYLGRYIEAEDYLKKALKIFRSVDSPSKLRVTIENREASLYNYYSHHSEHLFSSSFLELPNQSPNRNILLSESLRKKERKKQITVRRRLKAIQETCQIPTA